MGEKSGTVKFFIFSEYISLLLTKLKSKVSWHLLLYTIRIFVNSTKFIFIQRISTRYLK